MYKYIAKFIDNCGLYQLHRDRSKQSHFRNSNLSNVSISEIHTFYPTPTVPKITFEKHGVQENHSFGRYTFESEIENEPFNKYSTGLYYENVNNDQKANVIVVHGWRMDDMNLIEKNFSKPYRSLGYNVYTFTLPDHLERASEKSLYSGELMVSANIDHTLQSAKQAVTDIRALILWLKENKQGKIILIGVSLGGFVTNMTAVMEKNIDALISVFYANSIAYSTWKTKPGKYIRKDLEKNGFSYEQLEKAWAITVPSNFKPIIPKDRILLFSGLFDQYVVSEDTDRLWKAWDCPKRIQYPWGHAGIILCRDKITKESFTFLNEIVNI